MRLASLLAAALLLAAPVAAQAQSVPRATAAAPVYEEGSNRPLSVTLGGALRVTESVTPVASTSTATASGSLIAKASAGSLIDWQGTAGASAGYFLLFNSTTVPADGTVAPVQCVAVAANSTVGSSTHYTPERFTTGITVVFSTTGCFTKTISATAFIRARVQ